MTMKLKITLSEQEVKRAIAAYATQVLGLPIAPANVDRGPYSFEPYRVELDTDEEQELASVEAAQELERITTIREAA